MQRDAEGSPTLIEAAAPQAGDADALTPPTVATVDAALPMDAGVDARASRSEVFRDAAPTPPRPTAVPAYGSPIPRPPAPNNLQDAQKTKD